MADSPHRSARTLLHLPEADWPDVDRRRFAESFDRKHDVFDDDGDGSRLKRTTRVAIRFAYRRWLGWIAMHDPELLDLPPKARATPETVKSFVKHLRATCSPRTVALQIGRLHAGLRFMYPQEDWSWLGHITRRLERAIPKTGRKPIEITSQRLIDASLKHLEEIDMALVEAGANLTRKHLQARALRYRDALLVAVEAFLPLRRSNAADLRIGRTLVCSAPGVWRVHLPRELTKNGEIIDGDLPAEIGAAIDRFIRVYRPAIFKSRTHDGLWASAKGQPATGDALYNAFRKEVRRSLDLHLTLHDARRVGVTTWCVHDPVNAAGAKDLLADRSNRVIAQHYNLANGIKASRSMAEILNTLRQAFKTRGSLN